MALTNAGSDAPYDYVQCYALLEQGHSFKCLRQADRCAKQRHSAPNAAVTLSLPWVREVFS
jgi:hypothetical protein